MNEELQGKLVEILASIQAGAKATGDFAMAQLPDIAQSYVAYGRAIETIHFLASLIVLLLSLWVAFKHGYSNASAVDRNGYWYGNRVAATVFGTFVGLFAFLIACWNAAPMLLVWFAPKVWLLKELASLVK